MDNLYLIMNKVLFFTSSRPPKYLVSIFDAILSEYIIDKSSNS